MKWQEPATLGLAAVESTAGWADLVVALALGLGIIGATVLGFGVLAGWARP